MRTAPKLAAFIAAPLVSGCVAVPAYEPTYAPPAPELVVAPPAVVVQPYLYAHWGTYYRGSYGRWR